MVDKNCVVLILVVSVVSSAAFPLGNVDRQKCKLRNGKFQKEGSLCQSYYECKNWYAKEKKCSGGNHFHPAKARCVRPEEFPCFEKPPKSDKCPRSNGKFLKPGTDCRIYYDCCDGKPKEKKCPQDFLFDPDRGLCEYPELYQCIEDPSLPSKCPAPNGKYLKEGTKCKTYYDCRNGVATKRDCPKDQLFLKDRQRCDWKELVTCDDTGITKYRTTSTPHTTSEKSSEEVSAESSEETKSSRSTKNLRSTTVKVSTSSLTTLIIDSSEESGESEETKMSTTISKHPSSSTNGISENFTADVSTTDSASTFSPSWPTQMSTSTDISPSTRNEASTDVDGLDKSSLSPRLTPSTPSIQTSLEPDTISEISTNFQSTLSSENTFSPTWNTQISTATDIPFSTGNDKLTDGDDFEGSSSSLLSTSSTPSIQTSVLPDTISEIFTDFQSTTNFEDTFSSTAPTRMSTSTDIPLSTESKVSTGKEGFEGSRPSTVFTFSTPIQTSIPPDSSDYDHDTVSDASRFTTANSGGTSFYSKITDTVTAHIFCPKPDGYFPHPTDRRKFIGCVGGIPSVMDCPSNLVYDHEKRMCDYDTQ